MATLSRIIGIACIVIAGWRQVGSPLPSLPSGGSPVEVREPSGALKDDALNATKQFKGADRTRLAAMFSGLAYLVEKDNRQWTTQQVGELLGNSLRAARLEGTYSEAPLDSFLDEHVGEKATAVEKSKVVGALNALAWGCNA